MTVEIDSWLTAVRLRRLPEVLAAIRTHPPPGVPEQRVNRVVWNRCDGPLEDTARLVDVLIGAGLVERRINLVRLTKRGRDIATQDHQHGGRLLARVLIECGYFRNQVRRLMAVRESDPGEVFRCRRASAFDLAPQLIGVLRLWPDVTLDEYLQVPVALERELLTSWVLHPIPRVPGEAIRNEIGDRAESYSFRWEQEQAVHPSDVHWPALDDDSLGYDVRNTGSDPERFIEVKGSQGDEVRFFLSKNQWEVGHRLGDAYEIHFWGGISLTRPRPAEYSALRKIGYPIVFRNIRTAIATDVLSATPSEYLVTCR